MGGALPAGYKCIWYYTQDCLRVQLTAAVPMTLIIVLLTRQTVMVMLIKILRNTCLFVLIEIFGELQISITVNLIAQYLKPATSRVWNCHSRDATVSSHFKQKSPVHRLGVHINRHDGLGLTIITAGDHSAMCIRTCALRVWRIICFWYKSQDLAKYSPMLYHNSRPSAAYTDQVQDFPSLSLVLNMF